MQSVIVLRTLWRHRIIVALFAVVAVACGWLRPSVVVRLAVVARLRPTRTSDRHAPSQFRGMVRHGRRGTRDVDRRRSGAFALSTLSASDTPHPAHERGDAARRCRTHDATHPCAGHKSGTARHDGVVQVAFGFAERGKREHRRSRERAAPIREDQAPTAFRSILGYLTADLAE